MAGQANNVAGAPAATANRRSGDSGAAGRVVVLGGATASGKSALARDIALEFGGTVINADSMQVYRELDVVTARPPAEDLAAVPHRLYGYMSGRDRCSVGAWLDAAHAEVDHALAAGRLPVLVGGTGLYLRAFMEGLADIPEIPATVTSEGNDILDAGGTADLQARLQEIDPAAAAALPPGDPQRLLRAWAVMRHTGRSLLDWQADPPARATPHQVVPLLLLPDRAETYARCNQRFAWMVDHGAADEVQALLDMNLAPDLPVMKAVGVPEIAAWLAGETSRSQMIAAGQQATRRYAKRQYTWFRHQMPGATVFPEPYVAQDSESLRQKIFTKIR